MQIASVLGKYALVPLCFEQTDLAATQTAAALLPVGATGASATNVGYTMPFAGEIIGVSINTTAAATAGTLTCVPTLATVVCTDPSIAITTAVVGSDTCNRGTNAFAKNAVIGAKVTTTADWDATGADLEAIVWVILNISGI